MKTRISKLCRACESKLLEWRRDFHRHPELSFQEAWTAARIQQELDAMGIAYTRLPGSHSFVGHIDCGQGKKLALRADMDALPLNEESELAYKSQCPGKMHACGHDAHIAMLLGAAQVLNTIKDELQGKIYLCFQSAEELSGGIDEIAQYLATQGGVDACAALHVWSSIPTGTVMLREGTTMAGYLGFRITLHGQGGHGSRPDLVRDPIKAACELALKLSAIPSNFYDVFDHCAVHICQIQGGTAENIFPDSAYLQGGARFFKPEGANKIKDIIRRIASGVAETYGVTVDLNPLPMLPPVVNDTALVRRARDLMTKIAGLAVFEAPEPLAASDNYGILLQKYPGFYAILGSMNESTGIKHLQHSAQFNIDESVLVKGCEFLAQWAVQEL